MNDLHWQNRVKAVILRYFTKFDSFGRQLVKQIDVISALSAIQSSFWQYMIMVIFAKITEKNALNRNAPF